MNKGNQHIHKVDGPQDLLWMWRGRRREEYIYRSPRQLMLLIPPPPPLRLIIKPDCSKIQQAIQVFLNHQALSWPKFRVRTHDQNFVPLMICNKIVTLLQINVLSWQINVPPCQINDPPFSNKCPSLANKCPLVKRYSKSFETESWPQGHLFARWSHTCVPFWPCVRALISILNSYQLR